MKVYVNKWEQSIVHCAANLCKMIFEEFSLVSFPGRVGGRLTGPGNEARQSLTSSRL